MAFSKYAKAKVVHPLFTQQGWDEIRQAAAEPVPSFELRKATQVVLGQYDPKQYLLTHCTIVASVDTESPTGMPLGKSMVDGVQVNRLYPDFYITTGTTKYINNNHDAFERKLLLAAFRSFVGGQNYVEHVQIPELSKGRIIDAAARDIGDSVYVDILVATERKHKALVEAITSGHLGTLSMGCFLPDTRVTLSDGRRIPIKDVLPGEKVLTHKGRVREVLNQQIRVGRWDMRRVKIVGVPDSIESTGNHPYFVIRPAQICSCGCGLPLVQDKDPVRRMSKRFRKGHDKRILNPNGSYSIEEARILRESIVETRRLKVEEVRADDLQVGDYVVFPKYSVEGVDQGRSRARLLGYFLAEGSFLKHNGNPCEVQFNFSLREKDTFVAEVVDLLKDAFPGCSPWVQDRVERTTCTVHVTGRDLVSWFREHGGEYSHRKHLSQEAMSWSVSSHLDLIGAWLNGDGTIHSSGASIGTTTSYDLACQLQVLAVRCGLPVRFECVYGGKHSTIANSVVNGESLRHPDTGKLAHFNLCFAKSTSSKMSGVSTKTSEVAKKQNLRVLEDMVIFPISKVESFSYEGAVFDLEVEDDHSYLVEGVAVHNCSVTHTVCSKCGNAADDETQLCRHIKYEKGNTFIDPKGQRRKVSELCGHVSAEPGSVKFIEASWVANPAFKGAVLRNILDPNKAEGVGAREKIQVAFQQPMQIVDLNAIQKAARMAPEVLSGDHLVYLHEGRPSLGTLKAPTANSTAHRAEQTKQERLSQITAFDDGMSQSKGQEESKAPESPFKKVVDDLHKTLVDEVKDRVKKELSESEAGKTRSLLNENLSNESLIKSALQYSEWRSRAAVVASNVREVGHAKSVLAGLILHSIGGWEAVQNARRFTGVELLVMDRLISRFMKRASKAGEARVYRTVISVGGTGRYPNVNDYLTMCGKVMGRMPTVSEKASLIEKGKLFSFGL